MYSIFIIIFYITTRVLLNSIWDQFPIYLSYIYEIILVALSYWVYKNEEIKPWTKGRYKEYLYQMLPWLPLGFILHLLAKISGITIPFDITHLTTTLLLLIVAPVLEELIFRYMLWIAVEKFIKKPEWQIWISAIFFSLGHVIIMMTIPMEFRAFVLYQAAYVLVLSIGASYLRMKSKGMLAPITVHFLFNLGFYLVRFV